MTSNTRTNFSRVVDGVTVYYESLAALKASMGRREVKVLDDGRRVDRQGKRWPSEENGCCNRCAGTGVVQLTSGTGICLRCKGTGKSPFVKAPTIAFEEVQLAL